MTKKELRQFIKSQITEHSGELPGLSKKICENIICAPEFSSSHFIFSYMPLPDEVDVLPLVETIFASDKKLALPRVDSASGKMDFYLFNNMQDFTNGTSSGYCGILEPSESALKITPIQIKEKSLILVPGRAFTLDGKRLGRGKGFYDSYLAPLSVMEKFCFAGVCFPFQIISELPFDAHDIPVQKVFSCSFGK